MINFVKNIIKKTIKAGDNLLSREQGSIVWATMEMMMLVFLTKILGVVKMGLIAGRFGAGRDLDIFYIANTIPELIFNIIAVGSVNAALIPVFNRCFTSEGQHAVIKLLQKVLFYALIAFVVLSGLMFVFAPQMISLSLKVNIGGVTTSFSEAEVSSAVLMMRVMLVSPILLGTSSIISSFLLVKQRYFATRVAPLLYNIGVIIGVLVFVPITGGTVIGLSIGVVVASVLHLVSQLPTLFHLAKFKNVDAVPLRGNYMRTIGRLALPRILSVSADQIGVVIRNIIAINLVPGSLSAYQFARNIFSIAVDMFGTTTAEAIFPRLSNFGAQGRWQELAKLFGKGFRQMIFLTLPISVLIIVLRLPIVRFMFGLLGSGFTWEDTVITSWILFFLGFLIVIQSLIALLLRGFYSLEDTKTPLFVSTIMLVLNIVVSISLVNFFSHFNKFSLIQPYTALGWDTVKSFFISPAPGGSPVAVGGLALGGTIVWGIEALILSLLLNKRIRFLDKTLLVSCTKKVFSSAIMGIGLYSSFKVFDSFLDTTRVFHLFLVLLISVLVGVSLFIVSEFVVGDEDIKSLAWIWRKKGKVIGGEHESL